MTVGAAEAGKLDMERVIRRTAEVVRRTWRDLAKPAALLVLLPSAIIGALDRPRGPFGMHDGPHNPAAGLMTLVALIPYAMFFGGALRYVGAELAGAPITVADAMAVGRRRVWAFIGLELLMGIGVMLGMVLLIVPGVILAMAWLVAMAVFIEEDKPIGESLRRSTVLTRGSRLYIFGVCLALAVAIVLAACVVSLVAMPLPRVVDDIVLWPLLTTATMLVQAVLMAVIYDELPNRALAPVAA